MINVVDLQLGRVCKMHGSRGTFSAAVEHEYNINGFRVNYYPARDSHTTLYIIVIIIDVR